MQIMISLCQDPKRHELHQPPPQRPDGQARTGQDPYCWMHIYYWIWCLVLEAVSPVFHNLSRLMKLQPGGTPEHQRSSSSHQRRQPPPRSHQRRRRIIDDGVSAEPGFSPIPASTAVGNGEWRESSRLQGSSGVTAPKLCRSAAVKNPPQPPH